MNNLTFNTEGPMMQGTWVNPNNGDSFTVRDSFFQDNQYMIQTTDGRMLGYNQISQYIKTDNPESFKKEVQKNNSTLKEDILPPEVANLIGDSNVSEIGQYTDILPEDAALITGRSMGSNVLPLTPTTTPQAPIANLYKEQDPNGAIIERALGRRKGPSCNVLVSWNDFPEKSIDMLIDLMGIEPDEIVNYYINKVDINEIKNQYIKSLREFIACQLDKYTDDYKNHIEEPVKPTKAEVLAKAREAAAAKRAANKSVKKDSNE